MVGSRNEKPDLNWPFGAKCPYIERKDTLIMNATPEDHFPEKKFGPPFGAIIGTILGVVIWLIFILLYALFWSKGYDLFQNVVVTIVSFLIAGLLIGVMWIAWLRRTGKSRMW